MIDALKKLDKKLLILAGGIIFLPIFIVVLLAIIQSCDISITYEKYEVKMIEAAQKYFEEKDLLPKQESEIKKVDLNVLIDKGYIKSTNKMIKDNSCNGSVVVRLNGSSFEENDGGFFNYLPNLECKDYETKTLIKLLKSDITTENSGLYSIGDSYVFKGDNPKNFVEINGQLYLALNIDKNGIVKLVKTVFVQTNQTWDTKYNVEVSNYVGKNIYADSNILKALNKIYLNSKKTPEKLKKKMIAYDVCVQKVDINNISLNNDNCDNVLENQVISLIDISDFSKASLDSDCKDIVSKSCVNYNYLKNYLLNGWTLNAVSNNSYQVYYIQSGRIYYQDADSYNLYNEVIYLDGLELVKSGEGKENSPYAIE